MISVSQICYGKWPAVGGFSVTNLGTMDRIRHDQDLADGGFSVTNLGNLDRIRTGLEGEPRSGSNFYATNSQIREAVWALCDSLTC